MKKILLWILVLAWMGLIFYFSSQNSIESTNQSRSIVNKTVIVENKNESELVSIDAKIRKIAHVCEFLVLGVLVCFLIKEYTLDIRKILFICFIIGIIYACSDELHQLYVPGRSGEISDVIIDTSGLLLGEILFYLSGLKIWKKVKK